MSSGNKKKFKSVRHSKPMKSPFSSACKAWKRAYFTKDSAIQTARQQTIKTGVRLRVYKCGNHWHLTSQN